MPTGDTLQHPHSVFILQLATCCLESWRPSSIARRGEKPVTKMATMSEMPILSFNAGKLGKVDPSNVGSVAKIWSGMSCLLTASRGTQQETNDLHSGFKEQPGRVSRRWLATGEHAMANTEPASSLQQPNVSAIDCYIYNSHLSNTTTSKRHPRPLY